MSDNSSSQQPHLASMMQPESLHSALGIALTRNVIAGAVASSAAIFAPAFAQETTLSTVTVTGDAPSYQTPDEASSSKFTAPLLDTPKSVTIIPEVLIKDMNATSLQDVLRTTPGITLGSGEGGTPTGDRPFIRGYEASTDIFIDGLRDYARSSHETFNLEAVEVIKGPSSAFTGRGGTGGSINLTTKQPKLDNFMEASAGFGNANQWRTSVDGNYAFSDTGAFRLNVMKMGGEVPGRNGVTVDRWGIAPSIAFGLNTPTRFKLSYAHIENNDMPDLGIPFKNEAHPELTRPINVSRDNFYGRWNTDFRENTMRTATAVIEHDFTSDLTLRNTLRQSKTLNHYMMTRPNFDNCAAGVTTNACNPLHPDAQFRRDDRLRWRSSTALINQTDLLGKFATGSVKHTFITGLEFSHEKVYDKAMSGGPGRSHDSLYNPNPNQNYSYQLTYGPKKSAGEIKTNSLYFFDTMELNEQWLLNAGLRRESFEVDNLTIRRKDNFWNYQLGLVFKPAANGSIYVSYGTSSNPAGENLGQSGGADGAAGSGTVRELAPEKSHSWELGTKWNVLNNRLSLTAAVFETKKTDARSTDPTTGVVALGGNNRTRGIELSATGAITPKWDIWAGITYLDPKVTTYRNGSNIFDGNRIKFIAKKSASIWSTYKVLPELTLGGGASYVGMRYVDDANEYELPSHVRYDAMAQYEFNKQFSLQFNVNNISNTEIYDASHVGIFANVGSGRSYMLTGTYRY